MKDKYNKDVEILAFGGLEKKDDPHVAVIHLCIMKQELNKMLGNSEKGEYLGYIVLKTLKRFVNGETGSFPIKRKINKEWEDEMVKEWDGDMSVVEALSKSVVANRMLLLLLLKGKVESLRSLVKNVKCSHRQASIVKDYFVSKEIVKTGSDENRISIQLTDKGEEVAKAVLEFRSLLEKLENVENTV